MISAQVAGSGVLANAADFNPSRLHAAMSPAAGVPPFFLGFAAFVGKVPHCFPCSFVMSRPLCAQGQQSGAFFAIHHSHARLPLLLRARDLAGTAAAVKHFRLAA